MWLKPNKVMEMAWKLFRREALSPESDINTASLVQALAKEMAEHLAEARPLDAMQRPLNPICLRRCKQIAELFMGELLSDTENKNKVAPSFKATNPKQKYTECLPPGNVLKGEASLLYEMQSEYFSTVLNDRHEIMQGLLSELDPGFNVGGIVSSCTGFSNFLVKLVDRSRNPTQVDLLEHCVDFNVLNDIEFDALCTLLETALKLGGLTLQQFCGVEYDEKKQESDFLHKAAKAFNHVGSLTFAHDLSEGKYVTATYSTDYRKDSRILFNITSTEDIGSASRAVLTCRYIFRKQNSIVTSEWMDISTLAIKHKMLLSKMQDYEFNYEGILVKS